MKNAVIHNISERLKNASGIRRDQQKNLDSLIRISNKFHTDANIEPGPENPVSEKLFVLESGHQPNFFPYPGVWKKVFLLHQIKEHLNDHGHDAIAVFGFLDQNLSTAKLLYENKIPAVNKQGKKKFGFKIKESEKWKQFNTLKKPSKDEWEQELNNLKDYYTQYLPKENIGSDISIQNIDSLTEIMETCYSRAENLADLNAFIFAGICQGLFDISVNFFRYSDVQQNQLFRDEWQKILDSLQDYIRIYNTTIREKELNLSHVSNGFFPFWYHCTCGVKVALTQDTMSDYKGTCPACKTEFSFTLNVDDNHLAGHMKHMGLSAVARNVIVSEGLGTHLFVSGSGGGLQYGKVANEISRNLCLNIPLTLSWSSRDYYIGIIHRVALNDTLRFFNLTYEDLISGQFNEKITNYRISLKKEIETMKPSPENRKDLGKYSGLYQSSATQLTIARNMFSTIPSIIDLLINFPASFIIHQWNSALNCAEIEDSGEIVLIKKDILYHQENTGKFTLPDIPRIYHSLDLIDGL
ncbi:MAG: hypothetical protein LUQ36_01070 [Methanoregula sp.]|nr:hypothetical protein [Methanoregula sp.]